MAQAVEVDEGWGFAATVWIAEAWVNAGTMVSKSIAVIPATRPDLRFRVQILAPSIPEKTRTAALRSYIERSKLSMMFIKCTIAVVGNAGKTVHDTAGKRQRLAESSSVFARLIVYPFFLLPLLAYEIHQLVTCSKHRIVSALLVVTLGFVLLVIFLLIIHR